MKTVILLFLLALGQSTIGQTKNPYLTLKFDKVIMYDFEPSGEKGGSIIEKNGQLTKMINKQVQLDQITFDRLNKKLGDNKSFGGGTASCFVPHLGFVYYSGQKVVGHITICMACNRLYSSIEIAVQQQGKVGTGNDSYYLGDGMSKSFRQFLNNLLKSNKFSHQATF